MQSESFDISRIQSKAYIMARDYIKKRVREREGERRRREKERESSMS